MSPMKDVDGVVGSIILLHIFFVGKASKFKQTCGLERPYLLCWLTAAVPVTMLLMARAITDLMAPGIAHLLSCMMISVPWFGWMGGLCAIWASIHAW